MVHVVQRRSNRREVVDHLSHAKPPAFLRAFPDGVRQGSAVDERHHHDVVTARRGLLGIELDHSRVTANLGQRLHFVVEAGAGGFIADIIQQHLDGKLTRKIRIGGMEDLPHAAFTQQVHVGVPLLLGQPLHEVGISHRPIAPYAQPSMRVPCPIAPKWRGLHRGSVRHAGASYATCCSL